MLKFLTGGESHGKCLVGILEGMIAGLPLSPSDINKELERRQRGYGRGERMKIEKDKIEILSGVRGGKTTGSPISLLIENKDWKNWEKIMDIEKKRKGGERFIPRPGHADFPGYVKYGFEDIRDVIERASARETAMRVAIGAICKKFLQEFKINIYSRVVQIGKVKDDTEWKRVKKEYEKIEKSEVRNFEKEEEMKEEIDKAKERGDSVGGIFEIIVEGVPPGLGSYVHWDRRMDALISFSLMSIPGIKGVEIGAGFTEGIFYGSEFHDEIFYNKKKKIYRKTNNAGGIEGGITNGEDLWIKCFMKPIPTLLIPLSSVNLKTMQEEKTFYERSDISAVVPASVVGENVIAFVIAREFLRKFGGDTLKEVKNNYRSYLNSIQKYWSF